MCGARRREIGLEKDDGLRSLSFTHPCMIKFDELWLRWSSRMTGSLGKPSHPKDRQQCLSLFVDWLPALFAHTVEYPRLRACIHKDGRRLCRVGEPVSILPQLTFQE